MFGDWLDTSAPPDNPRGGADAVAVRRHGLPRPLGADHGARPPRSSAGPRTATGSPTLASGPPSDSAASTSPRTAGWPSRPRPPTRWRWSSTCSPPEQRAHAGRLLAEQVAADGFHIATGFLGTPFVTDALTERRRAGDGLRAAAAAGEPVLAVPGDDGRDDDLGAVGLDAPRRVDQSRRHDLVQPLRVRRGRRLAAPDGRPVWRPAAPGLPAAADRPAARVRASRRPRRRTRRPTAQRKWRGRSSGTSFAVDVTVPPNTTAEVALPDGSAPVEVGSGRHSFSCTIPEPQARREAGTFWTPPE